MTKKDYKAIAEVLKRHNPKSKEVHDLIVDLCNLFYMDNNKFDSRKFIKAIEE